MGTLTTHVAHGSCTFRERGWLLSDARFCAIRTRATGRLLASPAAIADFEHDLIRERTGNGRCDVFQQSLRDVGLLLDRELSYRRDKRLLALNWQPRNRQAGRSASAPSAISRDILRAGNRFEYPAVGRKSQCWI
jgi:hypothetical protein